MRYPILRWIRQLRHSSFLFHTTQPTTRPTNFSAVLVQKLIWWQSLERQNVCTLYSHINYIGKYSQIQQNTVTLQNSSEVHQLIMWAAPTEDMSQLLFVQYQDVKVHQLHHLARVEASHWCVLSVHGTTSYQGCHTDVGLDLCTPPRTSPRPNQPYPSSIAISSNFSSLPPHHQPSPYPKSLRERFKGKLEE